jgi:chemotaxis protein MotB
MTRKTTFTAMLLLLGAAGCVTTGKYEQKEKEAAQADTRAKDTAAKLKECDGKVQTLQQKLDDAQKQLADATQSRDQLKAQAATLQEQKGAAEAKSAQYEQLAGSLEKQIKEGQIEVSELRDRMTVKLKDKILFPSGSAKLSAEGKKALDVVANVFKDLKGKNVIVGGYTDDVPVSKKGSFEDNWDLSSARAISVVRYLASRGVPPVMLGAAGFSQFRPVAKNDSPETRSQNRRIEIALTAADYQPPEVKVGK